MAAYLNRVLPDVYLLLQSFCGHTMIWLKVMEKIKLFTDTELEMGEIFQSLLTTNISYKLISYTSLYL